MVIATIIFCIVCVVVMVFSTISIIKSIKDMKRYKRLGKELDVLKEDTSLTIEQKIEKIKELRDQI